MGNSPVFVERGGGGAGREGWEGPFRKEWVEKQKKYTGPEASHLGFVFSMTSSVTSSFSLSRPFWGPPLSRPQLLHGEGPGAPILAKIPAFELPKLPESPNLLRKWCLWLWAPYGAGSVCEATASQPHAGEAHQ